VEPAERGDETLITGRDEPAVPPGPVGRGNGFASLAGSWQGGVRIGDDFDELPADLAVVFGVES
jgi:hypothetical protein